MQGVKQFFYQLKVVEKVREHTNGLELLADTEIWKFRIQIIFQKYRFRGNTFLVVVIKLMMENAKKHFNLEELPFKFAKIKLKYFKAKKKNSS